MATAAQLKKDLGPFILVGKGALGKLALEDLTMLAELVKLNELRSLCIDVENKRLVRLKAKVNVTKVTGTEHMKGLTKCKSLYLQWGKAGLVEQFEDGFFDNLESVEFQAGVVDHIPPGLLMQRELRVLQIHNTVAELPKTVDWPKLESLRIGSAGASLPACLVLPSLKSLAISADGSKLKKLPDNLGDMKQLESLDVSRNELTDLPASMAKLSALQHLSLSDNKLKTLPAWLADLRALETLSVDGDLPASLKRFGAS